jgi:phosphotransferase system enzyme I (PtsI)
LDSPDLFKTQLRAIYKAAIDAKKDFGSEIAIMFPMIISQWEVDKCKKFCDEVKKELNTQIEVPIGIMIETPAAVILADEFAKQVDFFSVGTNDLTQYTLALDRQGAEELDKYSDNHHPAVLKSLERVAKTANENGIWAGICGELAGDLELTKFFIEAGFKELSVSPGSVLKLREKVRSL